MCRATPTKITVIKTPTFRKRRRVRFSADAASTLTSEPTTHKALNNSCDPSTKYSGSFLSQEEIDNRWYNRFDEKCFRYEAVRDLAEYKRRGQKEMVPRGLEKHCPERRMHKKEAVRLVLLAQRMGYHPDEIAMVSQTKSSWNAEIPGLCTASAAKEPLMGSEADTLESDSESNVIRSICRTHCARFCLLVINLRMVNHHNFTRGLVRFLRNDHPV